VAFPPFEGSEVERFEEGNAKSFGALEAFVVLDRDLVGIFRMRLSEKVVGKRERGRRDEIDFSRFAKISVLKAGDERRVR